MLTSREIAAHDSGRREIAVVDLSTCDACGLCLPLCPPGALLLRRDGLHVDAPTCTGCRKCIDPCPVGALRMLMQS
jgi:NAD-dependent dihydropyrimidine dehydrogenase PreA subunit